ncbi:MAG: hypothetical protein K2G03_03930 [Bacilli bacterium]|nr:hypothetical protein [Bacilli bacterium]
MNLIIRDGLLDRYATNEEFRELESIINEDLRRTLIYLSECHGEKETLVNIIEKVRENINNRHSEREDLEISLVDNYVVFNLTDSSSNLFDGKKSEMPEIIIMKRNMRGIYFLKSIEKSDILTDKEEYLPLYQINFEAQYYDYSNHQIVSSKTEFPTYVKDEFEEPFLQTDQFMNSLNKSFIK